MPTSVLDTMAPRLQLPEGTSPTDAAAMMRDGILVRVQEIIADRQRAQVGAPARKSAEIGAQIASLNVVLAFAASIKVETVPTPVPPPNPAITMISDVNGIGRGYTVEATRDDRGNPRAVLRFVLWELDEPQNDGHRSRSIADIFELDMPYVARKFGPRAGLRIDWLKNRAGWEGIDRIAPEPIQAAMAEHQNRVLEAA